MKLAENGYDIVESAKSIGWDIALLQAVYCIHAAGKKSYQVKK